MADAEGDLLSVIADERRRLADLLDSLSADELATPSGCGAWTVQQVAGHLLMPLVTPLPRFVVAAVRARGNFDRANDRISRKVAQRPAAQIAAGLREQAANRFAAPTFGLAAPVTELLVHGQDIRRPFGWSFDFPVPGLLASLRMLASPKALRGFVPRGWLRELRFEATDVDFAAGSGSLVRGPGAALAYTMTGRRSALDELSGPGAAVLAGR